MASEEKAQEAAKKNSKFEWRKVGTRFQILWLFKYMAGAKPPPDESEVKGKSFLEVVDVSAKRIHAADGGLGIPNSFLYWHWTMGILVYLGLFSALFFATTPLGPDFVVPEEQGSSSSSLSEMSFPWLTLVHKLVIFFSCWESLGLGVEHGPLHQKFAPPFQDWWYRLTVGTLKYNAPFLPKRWFPRMKRTYLDVLIEGFLTYVFAGRALRAPRVTPALAMPIATCALYEFLFDYGQHIHDYGTQNLHVFICMCFPVGQGQIAGIQLFLTWFYFCSGACKLGPTFQYMFTGNLLTAKFMVDKPWSRWFRRTFYKDYENDDYTLKPAAWYLATFAACVEMTVPLLTWSNRRVPVYVSIFIFMCMHAFIVSTLIIDVFAWNFTDAIWYVILYGIVGNQEKLPGVDWDDFNNMHPFLYYWFVAHGLYVIYGHVYPNAVPYIVAHRHAAGNWSQGILIIKKTAAGKLANLICHAGIASQQPGWAGEWFSFHAFFAYVYTWNLPSKMLFPILMDAMQDGAPSDGMFHSSGDYVLVHSVLFFDALVAHLRFDGLSNVALVEELGEICGFEPGECRLAWAGAFPTFLLSFLGVTPTASWKLVDAKGGTVIKEGTYSAADVMDPAWKKPSDLSKIALMAKVKATPAKKTD